MSIKAIDLRRGMAVRHKNGIWVCQSNEKIAKGKGQSYQSISLKNIQTDQTLTERFRTTEPFDQAIVESKSMEYLYSAGDGHVVMDPETFEQISLPTELIGDKAVYLTENIAIQVSFVEGRPITAELPHTVVLEVTETPPEVKGATATNQMKEATCAGGARVKVPPFIRVGERIEVDTRSGEYVGRA
ncbi:MAG: elongation factor P [Phycisphaerae bacterium]|nr:elongation factor P [Phycisphaerae bacterium]